MGKIKLAFQWVKRPRAFLFLFCLSFLLPHIGLGAEPDYDKILQLMEWTFSSGDTLEGAIDELGNYRYTEVSQRLFEVIKDEFDRSQQDPKSLHIETLNRALRAAMLICNNSCLPNLVEVRARISTLVAHDPAAMGRLRQAITAQEKTLRSRITVLPSLVAEIKANESQFPTLADHWLERLDKLKPRYVLDTIPGELTEADLPASDEIFYFEMKKLDEYLNTHLFGQPEVVDRLKYFRARELIYRGKRGKSEILMMMGIPGTGKDTAAESYVDGIYGKAGAHETHLFKVDIPTSTNDLWKLLGSNTGFVGSHNVPPLLRYLVEHSGGKYRIEKGDGIGSSSKEEHIYLNDAWTEGTVAEGYGPRAYIFINEFHNWPQEFKDLFLKVAIEKNYFTVNNPGDGVDKVQIPITFLIASNDGMGEISSQQTDGTRYGAPLTYAQMMEKWEIVNRDSARLKRILETSTGQPTGTATVLGYSPPLLSRITADPESLILLRPHNPETLQGIVVKELLDLQHALADSGNPVGPVYIEWNDDLVRYIQEYKFNAEEAGRPMGGKVRAMVESTLLRAIQMQIIGSAPGGQRIGLSIQRELDHTASLVAKSSVHGEHVLPIRLTERDHMRREMTDEEILRYRGLANRIKARVFGVDHLAEKLADAALLSDEAAMGELDPLTTKARAEIFMFLGPSSTGKTEMAKAFTENYMGSDSELLLIDFNQVKTVHDLEERILGTRDHLNRVVESDFMKRYKRNNGKVVILLNEFSNADKGVLKALYSFLDEAVVTTFADRVARPMGKVKVLIDGNAGEEWYSQIPRTAPADEQQEARSRVYEEAMKDPGFRRITLETHFSEALINRVPDSRIFWFPPGTFKTVRQIAQLKLGQAIGALAKNEEQRRGWEVAFESEATARAYLDLISTVGYDVLREGRSLNDFVFNEIQQKVRAILIRELIPSGSKVTLLAPVTPPERTRRYNEPLDPVVVRLRVEGRAEIFQFEIPRPEPQSNVRTNPDTRILTAGHEIGHELMRRAMFGDKFAPRYVSVLPGVTRIGAQWIRYLGLASYEPKIYYEKTREAVVRDIACLAAGETAQRLTTLGARHDGGKFNDMERASDLARLAILKYGVSEAWGTVAAPGNSDLMAFVDSLSEKKKRLLEDEIQKLISEGRKLAESVLIANYDTLFIPMTLALAEKGELQQTEIEAFYHAQTVVDADHLGGVASRLKEAPLRLRLAVSAKVAYLGRRMPLEEELLPWLPRPKSVAEPELIVAAKKRAAGDAVPLSEQLVIRGSASGCHAPFEVASQ